MTFGHEVMKRHGLSVCIRCGKVEPWGGFARECLGELPEIKQRAQAHNRPEGPRSKRR